MKKLITLILLFSFLFMLNNSITATPDRMIGLVSKGKCITEHPIGSVCTDLNKDGCLECTDPVVALPPLKTSVFGAILGLKVIEAEVIEKEPSAGTTVFDDSQYYDIVRLSFEKGGITDRITSIASIEFDPNMIYEAITAILKEQADDLVDQLWTSEAIDFDINGIIDDHSDDLKVEFRLRFEGYLGAEYGFSPEDLLSPEISDLILLIADYVMVMRC